jgi:hypothetical protein
MENHGTVRTKSWKIMPLSGQPKKKSGHLKKNHATVRVFEKKLGQRKKIMHTSGHSKKNQATRKKIMALLGQFRKKSRHC